MATGFIPSNRVFVESETIPIVIIACRVLLVYVLSKICSNFSVSPVERRAERNIRVAILNVPSSVCEGAAIPVSDCEAGDEADVEVNIDADVDAEDEAGFEADAEGEAEDEAEDEAEAIVEAEDEAVVEDEVDDGGLPIAAAFVVIRAPPLVTTTPVAALLPELAVQLEVSTLVRLK